jgi:hypothetical protein
MVEHALERAAVLRDAAGDHGRAVWLRHAVTLSRTRTPGAGPGRPADDTLLREVGRVYNEAAANRLPPAKAVHDAFPHYTERWVKRLIQLARQARYIGAPPAAPGRPPKARYVG